MRAKTTGRTGKQTYKAFFAAAVLFSLPAAANWQDAASTYDAGRLTKLDEARAEGLSQAQTARDINLIRTVLNSEQQPASARALRGAWRCRMIKLGGLSSDIVYSWFRCSISERGERLYFRKDSGT